MKRRFLILALVALVVFGLLAWSPWMTRERAETAATRQFAQNWQGVMDGCGLNCTGCGVTATRRVWFGYAVTLEYACGMLPADLPEYHQRARVWVTGVGLIFGLPRP